MGYTVQSNQASHEYVENTQLIITPDRIIASPTYSSDDFEAYSSRYSIVVRADVSSIIGHQYQENFLGENSQSWFQAQKKCRSLIFKVSQEEHKASQEELKASQEEH